MPTTRSGCLVDQQLGDDRAARLQRRQIERRAVEHADVPLHQDRIAVPADVARVELEQPVGVLARLVEHALVADAEVHRLVHAVAVDQLVRHGRAAPADALVRLLQRDDVGVDFLQHLEHAMRIAAAVEPDRLVHVVAGKGDAAALTPAPIAVAAEWFLDVEVGDAQRIVLDELAARLDHVAHQPREDLVGDVGLRDFDPKQRAVGRIERRFPQLLGVHFAKTLVALDRQALAPRGEDRVEQLRRAGDRHRLALGIGRDLLGRVLAFARRRASAPASACAPFLSVRSVDGLA